MQIIEGFEFFPLAFDRSGRLEADAALGAVIDRGSAATDVVYLAHGFRNDADDATRLYTNFLRTFRGHLARPEFAALAPRSFVVVGVYWPSKPFRESDDLAGGQTRGLRSPAEEMSDLESRLGDLIDGEATATERAAVDKARALLPALEGHQAKQDEFVALVLSLLDRDRSDGTEGLERIRARPGSEILGRLGAPSPVTRGIGDALGHVAGGVGQFLNLTQWYVMKDRSGTVGATGVAEAVRAVHARTPGIRSHLVGHSLGGRLMASCAKSLGKAPALRPDSLLLLEAAFSHFGFSPDNGRGTPGFFRDVITGHVVKGPFVSTFSAQDTVVGTAYSIMSRLALDNTRAIGDASDEFGGIGRNGPLRTPEVATGPLRQPGVPYVLKADVINNLDGSGGLIKDHGDVTNDAVTYAFASAVAST